MSGCSRVGLAPPGFDARFSALCRRYSYRVCDDPAGPDPLRRHDTLGYRRPLDVAAMNEAAALLLGEHDFAAFCRRREGASTIRELLDLPGPGPSRGCWRAGWWPTRSATRWSAR